MTGQTDDDQRLGIASATDLGIVRRYSCGCAIVRPYHDEREVLQPALGCDQGEGHARNLVQGVETQPGLFL